MNKLLRTLARTLMMLLVALAAAFAPFAIKVLWPSRREHAIVELVRAEDAPTSPTPHLEWR